MWVELFLDSNHRHPLYPHLASVSHTDLECRFISSNNHTSPRCVAGPIHVQFAMLHGS